MKAIIDNKIYDTEKAEEIKTFYRTENISGVNLLGAEVTRAIQRECILYKTHKGNWFEHRKKLETVTNSREQIILVNEEDVKDIFKVLGDVENYEKYFDILEQA